MAAGGGEALEGGGVDVEARDGVALGDEVGGHAEAHGAEAAEADGGFGGHGWGVWVGWVGGGRWMVDCVCMFGCRGTSVIYVYMNG